ATRAARRLLPSAPNAFHTSADDRDTPALSYRRRQVPEALRVAAEHGVALVRRTLFQILDDGRHRRLVVAGDKAHGPVGSNHQTLRAKAVERDVEVRAKVGGRPAPPVRFGDQAGGLRAYVRMRGERAQIARPRVDGAAANVRLRGVIEDEALPPQPRRQLGRGVQMATIYEDVVGEIELFEQRQPGDERGPHEKALV